MRNARSVSKETNLSQKRCFIFKNYKRVIICLHEFFASPTKKIMNTSISSTSTSSPFITTTVPVTAYNLMLINATILSHLNCNDKGTSILDLRDPKHPQYKCDCYRFYYPLSFYSPCANCLQVYENPKDAEIQCLDICWPKQYTGNE